MLPRGVFRPLLALLVAVVTIAAAGGAAPVTPAEALIQATPADSVARYYSLIGERNFAGAWERLSANRRAALSDNFDAWVRSHDTTMSVEVRSVSTVARTPSAATVVVSLVAVDAEGGSTVARTFEGTWGLVLVSGDWKLDTPTIQMTNEQRPAPTQATAPARVEPVVQSPPPPAPPSSASARFESGTKIVGTDIAPGTYRSHNTGPGCYWARLSGLGGTLDEIIANENEGGPAVVTIAPTDKAFTSRRCASWSDDLSPVTASLDAPFGDGTYIIGIDVAPGVWRSEGGTSCYWARLSGFGDTLNEILANENAGASGTVRISDGDKGFKSRRCGTWTKIE